MNLEARVGVTANLNINYRAPTRADQFIVIKTRLVSVKGRKVEVSARIEDLDGQLLADGRYVMTALLAIHFTSSSLSFFPQLSFHPAQIRTSATGLCIEQGLGHSRRPSREKWEEHAQ